jgi:hypothetical protein
VIILAEHAAESLPDSISKRKQVLQAILKCLTREHRAFANVKAQLAAIEAAERLQSELPLMFQTAKV